MRGFIGLKVRLPLAFLAVGGLMALLGLENTVAQRNQANPASVTIGVEKREYQTLEPIKVTVLFKNESEDKIYLMFGHFDEFMIDLKVSLLLNKRWREAPKTQFYAFSNYTMPDKLGSHIAPGGTWEVTLVANMMSDMTMPGEYEVSATVPYWLVQGRPEAARKTISSESVKIQIERPSRIVKQKQR